MIRITNLLAIAGTTILLASCGGKDNENREKQIEDAAQEHAADADVTLRDMSEVTSAVVAQTNDAQAGRNPKLPDDFPRDVAVPDEWSIMSAAPMDGGFMLTATTTATVEEALELLREQMTAAGWTEVGSAQAASVMTQIGFTKDGRVTNLNIIKSRKNRNVQLVTIPKKN